MLKAIYKKNTMMKKWNLLIISLFISQFLVNAQGGLTQKSLEKMFAETKQVSQFFRRFNAEEDIKGQILYEKDKDYRNIKLRKSYFPYLFDQTKFNHAALESEFQNYVITNQHFLSFYSPKWMAQVQAEFLYNGKPQQVELFFKIEMENGGSKWVLHHVYTDIYQQHTELTDTPEIRFIHPKSHELDFMNLGKVFTPENNPRQYTYNEFKPDWLSIFVYEYNLGQWKFKQVTRTWFHVWQVPNWYFTLEYINRNELNSGWMITNLIDISKIPENELEYYIVTSLH